MFQGLNKAHFQVDFLDVFEPASFQEKGFVVFFSQDGFFMKVYPKYISAFFFSKKLYVIT